jgi:hypothetical protein
MRYLFPIFSLLIFLGLAGCGEKQQVMPCLRGTLLASTCEGGYFIQADTSIQPAIGYSYIIAFDTGDSLSGPALRRRLYKNVIFAASPMLKGLSRGQKFYFQYQPGSPQALPPNCPADTATYFWHANPYPPIFELLGVSASSCSALLPE